MRGLGQAEARRLEPYPSRPYGWQESKYWGHHLLPPGVYLNRKLESEERPGLDPNTHTACQKASLLTIHLMNVKYLKLKKKKALLESKMNQAAPL